MSAPSRYDVILWGALGCALVGTAHAEYTLATAAHFNKYVALAVPGALDLYVIRALQQRRDVLVAVLAMVAANVTSHLITGGVLAVTWHVIAAVSAVAPLIVWRVYSLKYTRTRQELLWGSEAGAVSAPVPETSAGVLDHLAGPEHAALKAVPDPSAPVPDHVPASWMEDEYPETHPSAQVHALDDLFQKLGPPSAVPYLKPVPDLPPEYAPGAVHSVTEPLMPGDMEYLAGAQEYVDKNVRPSVRGLKTALKIGQSRAERLLAHLGVKP